MRIPLVSILIPAFNAEKWIADALNSALNQTWSKTEIIVVDDGSRDRTLTIAKNFESATVKVLSQPNQGASAARNNALSVSQGDFIQWLDADDVLAADKIENHFVRGALGPDTRVLLSSAWARFYRNPLKAKFRPTPLWRDLSPVEWLIIKMVQNDWMATQSWLISRKLAHAAGSWDVSLLRDNDGEYMTRVICASESIRFDESARSYVRRGLTESVSSGSNLSPRKIESIYDAVSSQIRELRNLEDSPRVRAAALCYLNRWSRYFYFEYPALCEKAQALARELGSTINPPSPSFKDRFLRRSLGVNGARRAKRLISVAKTSVLRFAESIG
jgi:glycosyltransferase involved in cell wall biosynthesis